jgi:hypothetical protein
MQKPSVGRIVHYTPHPERGKGQPYPAIITHVWGDSPDACVNLHVFGDGTTGALSNPMVTSVTRDDSGKPGTCGGHRHVPAYVDIPVLGDDQQVIRTPVQGG